MLTPTIVFRDYSGIDFYTQNKVTANIPSSLYILTPHI